MGRVELYGSLGAVGDCDAEEVVVFVFNVRCGIGNNTCHVCMLE